MDIALASQHHSMFRWGDKYGLWVFVSAIILGFGVLAIRYHWYIALIPIGLLASAVIVFSPRTGIFILLVSMYLRYSLPGLTGVYIADILSFVFIGSVIADRTVRGQRPIAKTPLNIPLLLIVGAFALSLVSMVDPALGIKNFLRHVQLFALLVAVASCVEARDVPRILRWLLFLTGIIATHNIIVYLLQGGGRVFGPPGPFFEAFSVMAILHAAIGALCSKKRPTAIGWSVLMAWYLLALVCTQTRGPLLQLILGVLFLIVVTLYWARLHRHGYFRRRAFAVLFIFLVGGTIVVSGVVPIFNEPAERILNAIEGQGGTVKMRLYLWRTGWQMFLDAPLLGNGLAQMARWDWIVTGWHLDPMAAITRHLGAHNDLINYLAGTGLLGISALFFLFWRVFRMGARSLGAARTPAEAQRVLVVWIPCCAIIFLFFFAPHMFYSLSGMLTSVYFGLLVKQSVVSQRVEASWDRGDR